MTEEAQNLAQQVQQQTRSLLEQIQQQVLTSAHDFYGNSLGSLESRLANDRAQLQDLLEQLPDSQEEARARIEQLVASYKVVEDSIGQAAQEQGVEEVVSQAVQQAQEAAGQATQQAQEAAGQATGQAQEVAGQAAQQVQGATEETIEQLQEPVGRAAQGALGAAGGVTGQTENVAGQATEQVRGTAEQATRGAQEEAAGRVVESAEQELNATHAAVRKAEELGVDLSEVVGSGTDGRITIDDVKEAAQR